MKLLYDWSVSSTLIGRQLITWHAIYTDIAWGAICSDIDSGRHLYGEYGMYIRALEAHDDVIKQKKNVPEQQFCYSVL